MQCDDQGPRYSCPGDQVQLRHISGQLNEYFRSLENHWPSKSQRWLEKSIKVCSIHVGRIFGSSFNLKMLYF